MTNAVQTGKRHAGNRHARFGEGEAVLPKPGCGSFLCKGMRMSVGGARAATLLGFLGVATAWAVDLPTAEKTVEVNVPEGETLTVSRLADYFSGTVSAGSGHYFNKTGGGTLVLSGDVQFLNMNISNGVVRVARADHAEALRYVFVSEGATLVFDQDNPIRDYGAITAWGTVDFNGHQDTFSALTLVPPGRLVDTSGGRSQITLNTYFKPGKWFDAVKVRVLKTSSGSAVTELDEFNPTYRGVPLIVQADSGCTVSGRNAETGAVQGDVVWWKFFDKHMSSGVVDWPLTTDAIIDFRDAAYRLDGYRMAARVGNGGPAANSPVSWEIYGQVGDYWGLVDRREDVPFSESFAGRANCLGPNFTFSRQTFVADNVTLVVAGSTATSTTRSDAFGVLAFDSTRESPRTEITSGHTAVVASDTGVYEAKWVRVRPTSTADVKNNQNDYGYNWAMGSFKLLDEKGDAFDANTANTVAPHSSGLTAFTAGSDTTRSLVGHAASGPDYGVIRPVVLGFNGATRRIRGYRWRPSTNGNDTNRKPTGLVLEVSMDDKAWNAEDKEWRLVDVCGYPIPSPETNARDPRNFPSQAFCMRYFRLEVCESLTGEDNYVQFAELNLYRNGVRVDWPAGTKTSTTTTSDTDSSKIVNNVRALADQNSRDERVLQNSLPYIVEIDAGESLTFDAIGYTTTGGGYHGRMPKSWRVMVRNSTGEGWRTAQLHAGVSADFRRANYCDQGPWPTWGYDVIGDAEEVVIHEGATLELNTAYEKFGALNGAGTLQLDGGKAEISVAGGDFSGQVGGTGALVISADQNFAAADLSGVSTLELAAGRMTGSASFGGKALALTFTGGVLDATLSDMGDVSVTGPVKIAVPGEAEIKEKSYAKTLVANASLDEAARMAFRNATFERPDDSTRVMIAVEATETSVVVSARLCGFTVLLR